MPEKDSLHPANRAGHYLTGAAKAQSRFVVVAAALGGFAFGVRGVLSTLGEIRYWSPETPLEYTAAALLSVAMLFLGATLWALGSVWATHDHLPRRAAKLSRFAVRMAAVGAVLVSVSNCLEDYLRLRWFGLTFVMGSIALLLGLLAATSLRLAAPGVDKIEGMLLLALTAGVVLLSFSMGVGAAALLLLAAYHAWFRDRRRVRARAARAT